MGAGAGRGMRAEGPGGGPAGGGPVGRGPTGLEPPGTVATGCCGPPAELHATGRGALHAGCGAGVYTKVGALDAPRRDAGLAFVSHVSSFQLFDQSSPIALSANTAPPQKLHDTARPYLTLRWDSFQILSKIHVLGHPLTRGQVRSDAVQLSTRGKHIQYA